MPETLPELLWGLAIAASGVAGYFLKRLVERFDKQVNRESERQKELSAEFRQLIETVEQESLQRDNALSREVGQLRQYVDGEFVRQREMASLREDFAHRFAELKEDIRGDLNKNFELLFRLVKERDR